MESLALYLLLVIILTLSQLINAYSFFVKKEYMYMFETIGIYLIYLVFAYIDRVKPLNIKYYIKILVTLVIILHSLLGHNLKLYLKVNWFDDILHFLGTFSFSLLTYSIIQKIISVPFHSKTFTFILILSLGISLGAVFEVVEFTSDVIFKTNHQKGLIDTNIDLIFDVLGSTSAATFIMLKNK